ncbi:MAG: alpha/beta hydrolase [Chloroflexota bacterium]|nr:alpha/beta hydrolase [Chloroflexota bacterium]
MASDYLEPVAEALSDAFEVILVDPPGCGRSASVGAGGLAEIVGAIDQVRTTLKLEEWIIGGHSFGADLALAYALERPRHTGAVFAISPSGVQDDRDWHRAYEAGRQAGQDQVAESAFDVDPETHAAALASWREYIKQPHLLRRLADLATPYLAVIGSDDVRPSWPVEQVAALLPRGEVVVLEGAGHSPWWTHPTELRQTASRLG